jgi:hypothetical protein
MSKNDQLQQAIEKQFPDCMVFFSDEPFTILDSDVKPLTIKEQQVFIKIYRAQGKHKPVLRFSLRCGALPRRFKKVIIIES